MFAVCKSFSAKELAVCKSFLCANFVSQSSTGTYFVQALQYKGYYYWVVLWASFVVQISTGKYFGQAL